jgi:16S rRNA (cytidine1402-2'-O)-methyltransferase
MGEKTPQLYLIGTPLGNLQDVTLRAVETLKALPILFAEDTRELGKLLELLGIGSAGKEMHSYANHNLKPATEKALRLMHEGKSLGFVSDRGMPGISDPGAFLVARAREAGFGVIPVPGPSAPTTLLSVSGYLSDRFVFLGFPPDKKAERDRLLDGARDLGLTLVFFESPRRVRELIAELKVRFPRGRICLGREMTKLHETLTEAALADIDPQSIPELGEFTVAVDPGPAEKIESEVWEEEVRLRALPEKDWAKAIAQKLGVASKEIYNALQKKKSP